MNRKPTAIPVALLAAITKASEAHDVPIRLLSGVAWVESEYNANAFNSETQAAGAFQLKPATAQTLGVGNPYDVVAAADGAARFLAHQRERFLAIDGQWLHALGAYRWGPSRVAEEPNATKWPQAVQNYALRVLEAANATQLPFDGDVLMVSRSQKSLSRSPSLLLPALRSGRGL